MPGCSCGSACQSDTVSPRFRKALLIALIVNAAMFAAEVLAGLSSGSSALWADALDFAGDAANYAISLAVIAHGARWRSRAAWIKGAALAAFGCIVLGKTGWALWQGIPPEAATMGVVGLLALCANGGVAWMLYHFRDGDANMRSVWLCSRNDAIGNLAVMFAAAGVFGTGSLWPDVAVALLMAGLGISAGISIVRHARRELAQTAVLPVLNG